MHFVYDSIAFGHLVFSSLNLEMTHRVTSCPCCRHFSGLGSPRLQSKNALFCAPHLELMCLDADISTAEVVIGAPSTSDSAMAPARPAIPRRPRLLLCPLWECPARSRGRGVLSGPGWEWAGHGNGDAHSPRLTPSPVSLSPCSLPPPGRRRRRRLRRRTWDGGPRPRCRSGLRGGEAAVQPATVVRGWRL
ncbi:hypothetical protein KC19_4G200800 [Ceratodon purpureus]|uniref:Uncharacterized protein n=1 Tax=Ceratodon purpureus TaxID=3225 RepID=A0A8T0IAU3_CERPU|nr:hypothetical protein KC19_4G200800 [Ceratodon purpureus]